VLPLQVDVTRDKRVLALDKLLKLSDKLIYCTYDYISKPTDKGKPLAPISWIEDELSLFF